jgi:hypothetical protein
MAKLKENEKSKGEQERQLSRELEMTFPASDPPAATQPGGGVTGPGSKRPAPAKRERRK